MFRKTKGNYKAAAEGKLRNQLGGKKYEGKSEGKYLGHQLIEKYLETIIDSIPEKTFF